MQSFSPAPGVSDVEANKGFIIRVSAHLMSLCGRSAGRDEKVRKQSWWENKRVGWSSIPGKSFPRDKELRSLGLWTGNSVEEQCSKISLNKASWKGWFFLLLPTDLLQCVLSGEHFKAFRNWYWLKWLSCAAGCLYCKTGTHHLSSITECSSLVYVGVLPFSLN